MQEVHSSEEVRLAEQEPGTDSSLEQDVGTTSQPIGRGTFDDPVVRRLSIAAAAVTIMFLSTIIAALFLGILGSDVPRTALKRDLATYENRIESGSTDPEVWKAYVSALVDSGQLQRAQQVVDRGMRVIDDRAGADMAFAQAQVLFSGRRYEQAVDAATDGIEVLEAYHEAQLALDDSPERKGLPISDNYWGMLYLRARSYVELRQYEAALKDLDSYLAEKRQAADVFTLRGDVNAELGNLTDAESDYRAALSRLADYQPAIDGLRKLGVE